MKKIRVNYIDTPKPVVNGVIQDEQMRFIHARLSQYYDVEIDEKNPQIVFCDIYDRNFAKYNAIRVLLTVEEYAPDFTNYDYAITTFNDFSYEDRVFCMNFLLTLSWNREDMRKAMTRGRFTEADLAQKTGFCSFVQSKAEGADPTRIEFYKKLSEYKKVDSGGRVLNNVGGPVADKAAFEQAHKFSISFLNGRHHTLQDRPLGAFAARTLPIYWGNEHIGKIYNTKAFINCMDYQSLDDVIEFVKEVDQNDELYIKMMNEPIFAQDITMEREIERLDRFLTHIVENGSIQRSGAYWNRAFEKAQYVGRKEYTRLYRVANRIRPITKTVFASAAGKRLKQRILSTANKIQKGKAYKDIR